MKFIKFFIVFVIFYTIFDWIIDKIGFHNKLRPKLEQHKYCRIIFILVMLFIAFLCEYQKEVLNETYGKHNYISIIMGAFIGSMLTNLGSIIFRRSKS